MKVNFMLIGAGKAGTTTLADILSNHPEVSFCSKKEPNFFSKSPNWKVELIDYHNLFKKKRNAIYGEASTSYTMSPEFNPEIWKDIHEYNDKMKFIYIVRNPVQRAISQYMQSYQLGKINYSIEDAIKYYPRLINPSRYFTQIKPYIDLFGKEQVLIIDFADFLNNKKIIIENISGFLGISFKKFVDFENSYKNASINSKKLHFRTRNLVRKMNPIIKYIPEELKNSIKNSFVNPKRVFTEKPKLSEKYQRVIINLTKQDIIALATLTGKNFNSWLEIDKNLV
ncbi:MAG: sulfotransferase family protein [bacterium]